MRWAVLLISALLLWPSAAIADCTDPAGANRSIVFSSSYNVPMYCDDSDNWIAMVGAEPTPTGPQNCPNIGDTCDDGSIYAGLSPDGNVPMYTTPADAPSTYSWNDGTTNYTGTGMAYCTDVPPGTAATCQTGEANTAFLVGATGDPDYPFAAAEYCDGLSAHGHSDWYLPAQDELNVLYTNKNTGDFNGTFNETGLFPAGYYWSSSENNWNVARQQRFSDGSLLNIIKYDGVSVRCVRRHEAGEGLSQQTQIVPNGLVGHWRLDETSGTTAIDSGSYGLDAAFTGVDPTTNNATGIIDTAIDFSGTQTNRAETAASASYAGLTAYTFSAWVNSSNFSTAGFQGIFGIGDDDTGLGQLIFDFDNNNLSFIASAWSVTDGNWRVNNAGIENQWIHVAVTYDYSGGVAENPEMYVNGILQSAGETVAPDGTFTPDATYTAMIGNVDLAAPQRNMEGLVDDVRLYDRVLTAAEVREIYEARDGMRYNNAHRTPEFFDGNKYVPMRPAFPDVTDGLVGHWKLDETSGTTAFDSSGNGNDGTMTQGLDASTDSIPGAVGTALTFDGVDDFIDVGEGTSLEPPLPVTVSAWLKTDTFAVDHTIFRANDEDGRYNGYWCEIQDTDGDVQANFGDGLGGNSQNYRRSKRSASGITLGQWNHVVCVINGASDMSLYINGVDVGGSYSGSGGAMFYDAAPGITHTIGVDNGGATEHARAHIDEIRVYDRALSASEIQKLYNMGTPVGQNTSLPQGCPNIGDVCDDGTVYAGLSPDGNSEMYVSPSTQSTFTWGPTGVATGITNTDTGEANTAALAALGSGLYPAAEYCYNLVAHGTDDWYLPAISETGGVRTAMIGAGLSVGNRHWSSTESTDTNAAYRRYSNGSSNSQTKGQPDPVDCVRKGPAPRCANPYGLEGQMVFNSTHNVVQYCDGARWIGIGKTGP